MKKLVVSIITALALIFAQSSLSPVAALNCTRADLTAAEALQCGTNGASGNETKTTAQAATSVNGTISKVLNILSAVVGLAAVIMIILAGFKYITSGGKDDAVKSAKNTILYAVIGLVVVALAQIIVQFVLSSATNSDSAAKATNTTCIAQGGGVPICTP